MLGGQRTYELVFEDCRIPDSQVLGQLGKGYAPMQLRLTVRRLQMGAWCIGMTRRALDMMMEHAKPAGDVRPAPGGPAGHPVVDRRRRDQDARLPADGLRRGAKADAGRDVRTEASMVKLYGTEMATEIIDHAMQTFGAMGVAKELPLQLMAQKVRTMRVYEGPSEVHRMAIARRLLDART